MRYVSVESLCILAFVRSGQHTLRATDVWEYGTRLERELGNDWVVLRGRSTLASLCSGAVDVQGEDVLLTTDTDGLGKAMDMIPGEAIAASGRLEWRNV